MYTGFSLFTTDDCIFKPTYTNEAAQYTSVTLGNSTMDVIKTPKYEIT